MIGCSQQKHYYLGQKSESLPLLRFKMPTFWVFRIPKWSSLTEQPKKHLHQHHLHRRHQYFSSTQRCGMICHQVRHTYPTQFPLAAELKPSLEAWNSVLATCNAQPGIPELHLNIFFFCIFRKNGRREKLSFYIQSLVDERLLTRKSNKLPTGTWLSYTIKPTLVHSAAGSTFIPLKRCRRTIHLWSKLLINLQKNFFKMNPEYTTHKTRNMEYILILRNKSYLKTSWAFHWLRKAETYVPVVINSYQRRQGCRWIPFLRIA